MRGRLQQIILPILSGAMALAVPLGFGLVSATQGRAQTQVKDTSVKLPVYDVASIKPGKPGMGSTLLFRLDGLTASRMTLKSLIREAYGIENDQILGAPSWLNTQTYDIEAKVDGR
jgi:bla regulator protein blaR1